MPPSSPTLPAATPLARDVRDGARVLALEWRDHAERTARALLETPDDPDAVHDLRVALTRLRGTLDAFADVLQPVGAASRPPGPRPLLTKPTRRALHRTHRALGRLRDLDVQRAALGALAETSSAAAPPDAAPRGAALATAAETAAAETAAAETVAAEAAGLAATLAAARPLALRRALRRVQGDLAPALERARIRIAHYHIERVAGEAEVITPLARTMAEATARLGAQLRDAMARADAAATPRAARDAWHRVRLVGKQLRALLAPVAGVAPDVTSLFAALTALQDTIGDARDAHLLRRRAQQDAPHAHALHAELTARRRRAEAPVFALMREREPLLALIGSAAAALVPRAPADLEIERKYLLTSVPSMAEAVPPVRITQGWLPGERLRERLRRSVFPDGHVEWTRTVKLGSGISRIEVEEPTDAILFESLWPLTAGARISKRRHTVHSDGAAWEIDVFLDRPLVLAEIELPSEDAAVTFPDWLAPHVAREVTGEAAYVNANLARSVRLPDST